MLNTTTQSLRCILEQEYQLLLKDVIRYSIIQRSDVTLFEEVEDFLLSIRMKRREQLREQAKLKCTCSYTYKESVYVDSRIKEIERTVERIEEIDNEFMDMMNWYDNPAENESNSTSD